MHQESLKLASSQEQNAAQAIAKLSEVEKQRDQLEQRTLAQQAKIENTVQVSFVPRPCTCSYIVCYACAASQEYTWKGVTYCVLKCLQPRSKVLISKIVLGCLIISFCSF